MSNLKNTGLLAAFNWRRLKFYMVQLGVFSFFIGLYACVEEYDIRYPLNANVLTVDGFVIDQPGTVVNISTSRNQDLSRYSEPIKGCKAEIRVGNGTVVALREVSTGTYAAPSDFKGQAGQTYQLFFTTPDGNTYESSKEVMGGVPPIKKVYQQFDPNGILDKTGKRVVGSTVDIFVDFDDPPTTKNFYLWRWKLYEEQYICITCEGGTLSGNGGVCIKSNSRNPPTYDYQCDKACWDVFYNNDVNIYSDQFSDGREVKGRLLAKVPYYSYKGGLLEIEQVGLSSEAYQYYKLLRDQTQTTGTLTDTPPAAIIGNIQNTKNTNEKVAGYFGAASSRKVQYWVDRSIYKDPIIVPILGRAVFLEPSTPFRPPSYPCVMGRDRTPVRPEGWR